VLTSNNLIVTIKTLSRIANWENMTEQERERTMRVIAARNRYATTVTGSSMHELTLVGADLDLKNKLTRSNEHIDFAGLGGGLLPVIN